MPDTGISLAACHLDSSIVLSPKDCAIDTGAYAKRISHITPPYPPRTTWASTVRLTPMTSPAGRAGAIRPHPKFSPDGGTVRFAPLPEGEGYAVRDEG